MRRRMGRVGHGVADLAVANVLDRGDEVPDLTTEQLIDRGHCRREDTDLVDDELAPVVHHPDAHAARDAAVDDAHIHNEPSRSPLGGGTRFTIASRTSWMPMPWRALVRMASSAGMPITSSISRRTSSTSALARSILLMTGTTSR